MSASDEDDDDAELRELDEEGNADEDAEEFEADQDMEKEKGRLYLLQEIMSKLTIIDLIFRGKDLLASDSEGEEASDILGRQVKKSTFEKRHEKVINDNIF